MPFFFRLVLLFVFAQLSAAANATLWLDGRAAQVPARAAVLHYEDEAGDLTIADALRAPERFRERRTALPAGIRWQRLEIGNASGAPLLYLLDLGVPDVELLQVWRDSADGLDLILDLDPAAPFAARPLAERMLALPIRLAPGETASYLLRSRTHGDTPLALDLWQPEAFSATLAGANLLNGVLIGVLLALAIFALLQYLVEERRAFLVYALMALCMVAFVMQFEGYNFAYLWPQQGQWNQYAPLLLLIGIQASQAAFAMNLFDMRHNAPGLYFAYRAYIWLLPVVVVLYLAGGIFLPVLLLGISYVVLVLLAGVVYVRRKSAVASFFLAGALGNALFSNLLFGLSVSGVDFPLPPFAFPKIGYVWEALCFAMALARQLQFLRRKVEDGLRRHLAEAEQLARVETEKHRALQDAQETQLQLAATGHDLSQPLASMRLALSLLGERGADDPVTAHIARTLDYTESLLRDLVQDARSGYAGRPTAVSLGEMLADLAERHRAQAEAKGLRLHVRASAVTVDASALILTRIVDNLLTNAVRYTERGRILLAVRYRRDGVEIQVRDSGPGFDQRVRARLLQPFEQGGAPAEGRRGYGLGLYIVQALAARSGYRLTVDSRPGVGSTFGVVIPRSH